MKLGNLLGLLKHGRKAARYLKRKDDEADAGKEILRIAALGDEPDADSTEGAEDYDKLAAFPRPYQLAALDAYRTACGQGKPEEDAVLLACIALCQEIRKRT